MSEGLRLAGFEVVGVDIKAQPHYRGGTFVQADALEYPLDSFDFIHASPPCQAHSSLRHVNPGRTYPDLIPAIRERLIASGAPYSIENVPGAPLAGFVTMLCGTMFGLQTPDGRAEIRRHRLFETSFSVPLRPQCRHGGSATLHVTGHGIQDESAHTRQAVRPRAMSVTGNTPQTNVVRNQVRQTYSIDDARAAMGIDWMPMSCLSQAIPPAYGRWIGERAIEYLEWAGRLG